MPPPDDPIAPRKRPPPPSFGKDKLFLAVLLVLAALALYLWLIDPALQRDGKSRVEWPAPKTKP